MDAVRTRAVRTALWSVSFVLVAALVVERLGVNLVMYRAFNPDCSALHTHAQCMRFSIYARNFQATRSHELAQPNGQSSSVPDLLEFAGRWATMYFQSVFFYRDRNSTWSVQPAVIVLGALVVVAAVVLTSAMVRSLFLTWGARVGRHRRGRLHGRDVRLQPPDAAHAGQRVRLLGSLHAPRPATR